MVIFRIFTVLAAVLHLGNILFESKADLAYSEGVDVKNVAQLKVVSDLLQVNDDVGESFSPLVPSSR